MSEPKNWIRIRPAVAKVAAELRSIKEFFRDDMGEPDDSDPESGWLDVRLQVSGDGWAVHYGDASYDQDHRGYWGASCLSRETNCRELARELIAECEDSFNQCQ